MKKLSEYINYNIIRESNNEGFEDIKKWYYDWFDVNGTETFTKDENGVLLINSKTDVTVNSEHTSKHKQWYISDSKNWAWGDVHFNDAKKLKKFLSDHNYIKFPKHLTISNEIKENNKYPIFMEDADDIEFIDGSIIESFVFKPGRYLNRYVRFGKNIRFPQGNNLFIIDSPRTYLIFKDDIINFNNRNNTEIYINCFELYANSINSSCDLSLSINHYTSEHDAEINVNKKTGNGVLKINKTLLVKNELNISVNGDFIYNGNAREYEFDGFKNIKIKKCNNIDIKNCNCNKFLLEMPAHVNNISLQHIKNDDGNISFNNKSTEVCNSLIIDDVDFENFEGCPKKCKTLNISNCKYIRSIKELPYNINNFTFDNINDKIDKKEINLHIK